MRESGLVSVGMYRFRGDVEMSTNSLYVNWDANYENQDALWVRSSIP